MARKKRNPVQELINQERKTRDDALRQEMLFLSRKVASNPLATGYYSQLKELLEDLLMLDLAQRSVEATLKFQTRNKVISVDDGALAPFRMEMERAKTLKLVAGILSITGHFDVDRVLEKVETLLYSNPNIEGQNQMGDIILQLKRLLDSYSKKMEKLSNKEKG